MSEWRDLPGSRLRPGDEGRALVLAGWVARRRDLGGLIFVDLRDEGGARSARDQPGARTGGRRAGEGASQRVRRSALAATSSSARPDTVNPSIATGEIEVQVAELEILSRSTALPFQLDEEGVDETLRIRYRWLDLRRERLQRNIRTRARALSIIRQEMEADGFVDIETPIMGKPTPEGARDFLIPTRLQPGRFFALPQSPQIYKQLLVIAGFERYYQIARCFRDEDSARRPAPGADPARRRDGVSRPGRAARRSSSGSSLASGANAAVSSSRRRFPACSGTRPTCATARTSRTCVSGSRSRTRRRSPAAPSSASSRTRRPSATWPVPKELSRSELAKLEEVVKGWGGERASRRSCSAPTARSARRSRSSLRPRCSTPSAAPGRRRSSARASPPRSRASSASCGSTSVASSELVDESLWRFTWVTDFPMLKWDAELERWDAEHHPFTRPTAESLPLLDTDPGAARAIAYDLVGNGIELAGGSFRIHEPELSRPRSSTCSRSRPRSSARSSASCSTRSRWVRRRTAGSRPASTVCAWRCSTSRSSATRSRSRRTRPESTRCPARRRR